MLQYGFRANKLDILGLYLRELTPMMLSATELEQDFKDPTFAALRFLQMARNEGLNPSAMFIEHLSAKHSHLQLTSCFAEMFFNGWDRTAYEGEEWVPQIQLLIKKPMKEGKVSRIRAADIPVYYWHDGGDDFTTRTGKARTAKRGFN